VSLAASLEGLAPDTIARGCAGDRRALEQILTALQRPFYNLALRMLHNRALAEDATQESLLRVVTHLSQYRHEAKFSTWATRVAVNAVLDFRSGVARQAHAPFDAFAEQLHAGLDATAAERPEDALLLKQAKAQCTQALLQCLDGDHRVAFVLGDILEFEASEAAEILEIEPPAFRKRLSRARAELTAFLAKQCSVHTAGAPCACHRQLGGAVRTGWLDPESLSVRIGDLVQLRVKLAKLDNEERTTGIYQGDDAPDLRASVLASVRSTLFAIGAGR
jgi:RNA polymerase sigma factor (sigma-70 family)